MEATLGQQIPSNTTIMDSSSLSVTSIPSTETPPPGYMSEDGDPMDQNDNLSEWLLVSIEAEFFQYYFSLIMFFLDFLHWTKVCVVTFLMFFISRHVTTYT